MVEKSTLSNLRRCAVFAALLVCAAAGILALAHFRMVLKALRIGFVLFNVLSFFYCLSLVGQKAWETSTRIAIALSGAAKEPENVERD
jgi:hypothetical protein